jgi:hypothetical protein
MLSPTVEPWECLARPTWDLLSPTTKARLAPTGQMGRTLLINLQQCVILVSCTITVLIGCIRSIVYFYLTPITLLCQISLITNKTLSSSIRVLSHTAISPSPPQNSCHTRSHDSITLRIIRMHPYHFPRLNAHKICCHLDNQHRSQTKPHPPPQSVNTACSLLVANLGKKCLRGPTACTWIF